jgi:hypothetical protein
LGQVVVRDGKVTFEPDAVSRFRGRSGEEVSLVVHFDFMEAGPERETFTLDVGVRVGDKPAGSAAHRIEDRPFVLDDERGRLEIPLTLGARGEHAGVAEVRARYKANGWGGMQRRDEPFSVDVSSTSPDPSLKQFFHRLFWLFQVWPGLHYMFEVVVEGFLDGLAHLLVSQELERVQLQVVAHVDLDAQLLDVAFRHVESSSFCSS